MPRAKPITTMVVGLGRIGWQHHIKAAAGNPHFKVTAAVETLAERRKEAEDVYGCRTFARLEDALEADLAEFAVVCTRSIDHCKHVVKSLRAGCHVFVEKPAAMSLTEMDRMIAAAKKAGRVLTVNQSLRSLPDLRFAREVIDSKVLGKIFWVRRSGHGFYRRNDWQIVKKYGGGLLYNGGVHVIDQLLRLADAPVADVWGDMKHTGACAGDADDFVKAGIRTKDGRLLEMDISYSCAFPQPAWLVCGNCGSLEISGSDEEGAKARLKYFDPKKAPKRPLEGPVPRGRIYRIPEELPWVEKEMEPVPQKPFPDFYDNLYKAIRRGAKPVVTAESVRETMRVMDQVRKSSQWKY